MLKYIFCNLEPFEKNKWIIIIYEMDEKTVGVLEIAELQTEQAYIKSVYIHEDYRRIGICQSMLIKAKELTRELGIKIIGLWVNKNNEIAIKCYQKAGFKLELDVVSPTDSNNVAMYF